MEVLAGTFSMPNPLSHYLIIRPPLKSIKQVLSPLLKSHFHLEIRHKWAAIINLYSLQQAQAWSGLNNS